MKLTIGGKVVSKTISQHEIEKTIQENILRKIALDVIEVSDFRLRKLADRIHLAAASEAIKVFEVIADLIEQGAAGVSSVRIDSPKHPSASPGLVKWKPLNYRYALWKERRATGRLRKSAAKADITRTAARAGGFFILSGRLLSYFRNQGRSIISSRFGGVQVKVQPLSGFASERQLTLKLKEDVPAILGHIHVEIFPHIAPSLMPSLASRKWTEANPLFEKSVFPEKTAAKLTNNKHGPHRPMVLPVVQFFILNRIPAAIQAELPKAARRILKANVE